MTLNISEQEQQYLLRLLEATHKTRLHELHHTDTIDYEKLVKEEIELIEELKARIGNAGRQ